MDDSWIPVRDGIKIVEIFICDIPAGRWGSKMYLETHGRIPSSEYCGKWDKYHVYRCTGA